jgi:phosphoenolpyruvate synthase/pyruvate phosphate dikinase
LRALDLAGPVVRRWSSVASVARRTSSAAAPHAQAYRNALQVAGSREIAILVQPLVTAEVSGVLFP